MCVCVIFLMAKRNLCLTCDDKLIQLAKERKINISKLVESVLKNNLITSMREDRDIEREIIEKETELTQLRTLKETQKDIVKQEDKIKHKEELDKLFGE